MWGLPGQVNKDEFRKRKICFCCLNVWCLAMHPSFPTPASRGCFSLSPVLLGCTLLLCCTFKNKALFLSLEHAVTQDIKIVLINEQGTLVGELASW